MRFFRQLLLLIVFFPVCCCPKQPTQEPEADYLLVDRQVTNFTKSVSPDGIEAAFSVSCDADWEVSFPEEASSWITLGDRVKSGKNSWTVPYSVQSNESIYPRSVVVSFSAGEHSLQVTMEQGVPDPLTLNKVPGFYGIEGANILPTGIRQSSSLHFGQYWSFRIIDPSTLTVYALGGIPWDLVSGTHLNVSYKVVRQGMEEVFNPAMDVEVVRVTGTLVWLRKSESEYFILER